MTSYLGTTPYLSDTTLASFQDLGYLMAFTLNGDDNPNDVSVPAGLGLFSLSLMAIGSLRRKRNSALAQAF